jgi:type IV pilus assembly protein PilQ
MNTRILTALVFSAALALGRFAALGEEAAQPAASAGEVQTETRTDLIDVNFPSEEIRNILRGVAELKQLNVVIPDTIVGRMSIKLRRVTWQQVYDVVLEPIGYTYVVDENIIKIRSVKDLMTEPMQTRVFIASYAKASDLAGALLPLVEVPAGGRAIVDARTNSIIVTERSSRLRQIEEIVKRLDRPTDQVMIESKFIEVTDNQLSDIGIDWSSLKGVTAGAKLDRVNTTKYDNVRGTDPKVADEYTRLTTAVLSMDKFSLVLNALKSGDKVEMVSNPTIVTMNNVPAAIHIGQEYPIPSYTYNEERGSYEISGFEYKPIGISLNVTPQVNNNGLISLQVKPEISSQNGTVNFGGASGAEIPIITQRRTSSTVTIKSGYTLAIGGLIQSTKETSNTHVPLLGRIPVLGHLFRSDSGNTDRRNLIIFITAKTLDPEGDTYKDVVSDRTMLEMGITDADVPGAALTGEEAELSRRLQEARTKRQKAEAEARMRIELQGLESGK